MHDHEHIITIRYVESGESIPIFKAEQDKYWGGGCACHSGWQAISELSLEELTGEQTSVGNNKSWDAPAAPMMASKLVWLLKLGVRMAGLPIKIVEMPPFSKPITLEVG